MDVNMLLYFHFLLYVDTQTLRVKVWLNLDDRGRFFTQFQF